MRDDGTKVVWFLAGVSIGAAIALLYAPTSGEETRKRLYDKTGDSREVLAGTGREFMEKGRELYDKGRRLVDDAAELFDQGKKIVGG
ncbi:MAG: YtxH domain-containing protein [Bryobacteraceae bacterium]